MVKPNSMTPMIKPPPKQKLPGGVQIEGQKKSTTGESGLQGAGNGFSGTRGEGGEYDDYMLEGQEKYYGGGSSKRQPGNPLEQQKASYQNYYNSMLDAHNAKKAQTDAARRGGYDAQRSALDSAYGAGNDNLNQSADDALRQAAINRQMGERNLQQQLSASGRSGGAAESTMLGMANNYGSTRGDIEKGRNNNLRDLELQKTQAIADIEKSYQDALANDSIAQYNEMSDINAQLQQAQLQMLSASMNRSGGGSGGSSSGLTENTSGGGMEAIISQIDGSATTNANKLALLERLYNSGQIDAQQLSYLAQHYGLGAREETENSNGKKRYKAGNSYVNENATRGR